MKVKPFMCCYSINLSCFLPSTAFRLPWMSAGSVSLCGLCRLCRRVCPLWRTKPVSHRLGWGELRRYRGLFGVWLDLSKPNLYPQRAALQRTEWLPGQLWRRGLWWESLWGCTALKSDRVGSPKLQEHGIFSFNSSGIYCSNTYSLGFIFPGIEIIFNKICLYCILSSFCQIRFKEKQIKVLLGLISKPPQIKKIVIWMNQSYNQYIVTVILNIQLLSMYILFIPPGILLFDW